MADTRTLTDRARSALIREWAADNGFEVSAKGRIPDGIVAAYEAATGHPVEDGPDWDAALAGAEGADPLAGLEGELDAAAEHRDDDSRRDTPPPPADLDEARARFAGKTAPPRWARDARPGKGQQPPIKVTRAVIGDIEGKLTLLLAGPSAFWQIADPICGGAFAENLDVIVRKAVPLICQSPDAVRWFTKGATFLLWLDLVWALQPVAQAVYAHHVAGTVMLDPVTGQPVPSRRLENGQVVPLDGAPQQPRPDLSAYTTQVTGHVPDVRPA